MGSSKQTCKHDVGAVLFFVHLTVIDVEVIRVDTEKTAAGKTFFRP